MVVNDSTATAARTGVTPTRSELNMRRAFPFLFARVRYLSLISAH